MFLKTLKFEFRYLGNNLSENVNCIFHFTNFFSKLQSTDKKKKFLFFFLACSTTTLKAPNHIKKEEDQKVKQL